MGEKNRDGVVRRFVKAAKRKGAEVHSHQWFASADFKDGRRVAVFVPETKGEKRRQKGEGNQRRTFNGQRSTFKK